MARPHHYRDRAAIWLVRSLPDVLISAPERAVLGLTQVVIGAVFLFRILSAEVVPSSLSLARMVSMAWAITFLISGVAVLLGILTNRRELERLGLALTILGGLSYVALAPFYGSGLSLITAIVFPAIALAAAVRLIVSTASQTITNGIARAERRGST